jgi:alcohol dehydrogenase class IV
MGVTEAMIEQVLDGAVADHSTATNPRPLTRQDFAALFAAALH